MAVRNLAILGSTGSIGTQTLSLVDDLGISVKALSADKNIGLLEQQIRKYHPTSACVVDNNAYYELKGKVSDLDIKLYKGSEGLSEMASDVSCDTVLNSVVGMAGLVPTMAAIEAGKDIALANKETLVAGGSLVTHAVKEHNVKLLPVDSEHSAIFQCLQDVNSSKSLKRILLTASGGPFFGKTKEELASVTVKDALRHPNWSMGRKITIDSATLMNKALELIEAMWLFGLPPEDIVITVHRQSILHSGVEFDDGAIIAQLGVPDMKLPIQYALTYPERKASHVEPLTIEKMSELTFQRPDLETFTALKAGIEAAKKGGLAPACANAANEIAVALFLDGKIGFLDIGEIIKWSVDQAPSSAPYSMEELLNTDKRVREETREYAERFIRK